MPTPPLRRTLEHSLDYVDPAKVKPIAQATAAAGVFTCPTLTFFKVTFGTGASDDEIRSRPDFRFVPPQLRESWFAAGNRLWASPPSAERRREYVRVRNELVREIHLAGGRILAGSDAPDWFLVYDWSLHRELRSLVEAGLSAYSARLTALLVEAVKAQQAQLAAQQQQIGTLVAEITTLQAQQDALRSTAAADRSAGEGAR